MSLSVPATHASVCPAVKPIGVYINGVWNNRISAEQNRVQLDGFLKANNLLSRFGTPRGAASPTIILAFNNTHGSDQDLYDVIVQKEREQGNSGAWLKFTTLYPRLIISGVAAIYDATLQGDPDLTDVLTVLNRKVRDSLAMKDYVDADFLGVINDINLKAGGSPLLLIPHSQGCLYASEIYKRYSPSKKISIAAIASPAAPPSVGGYVTSTNDDVIKWLSTLYPVLEAKTVVPKNPAGSQGHTLIFDYLGMPQGAAAIKGKISSALSTFDAIGGNGINISMSWSDLDFPASLVVSDHSPIDGDTAGGVSTYAACSSGVSPFTAYPIWVSSTTLFPPTVSVSVTNGMLTQAASVSTATLSEILLGSYQQARFLGYAIIYADGTPGLSLAGATIIAKSVY